LKNYATRFISFILYLCTDHIGFYEKYGFKFIGTVYHPWGDNSRIYETTL